MPDTQASETVEYDVHDSTIGVRLQLLRDQKGLSLAEVSEETHISVSNLKAIEGDNYDQLPADTFIRGLVTIYGNFLGIDGAEAARIFFQERDRNQPRGRRNRPERAGHSLSPKKLAEPSHVSSATIATILLLFIVVSFSAFCLYTGWNPFAYFLERGGQPTTPPHTGTVMPGPGNRLIKAAVSSKIQADRTPWGLDRATVTAGDSARAFSKAKRKILAHASPDTRSVN